jgi:CRP-like cAMP-binding protein
MLEDLDFLHGTAAEYLPLIASTAQLQEFPANTTVFREGQPCAWIYLVSQGSVALRIRVPGEQTVPIQTVGPGELLGWSPVLGLGPMTATAQTTDRCRLIALNVYQLLALCTEYPDFGLEFMRRMALALAKRLHATRVRLLQLGRHNVGSAQIREGSD